MDKKIVGLLGAVAGLATVGAAQAATEPGPAPTDALRASSYADLLAPVPNAVEAMKADDAARAQAPKIEQAQYYYYNPYPYYYPPYYGYPYRYYHHHHHHHHHWRRFFRHHHHHHHHHAAYFPNGNTGSTLDKA